MVDIFVLPMKLQTPSAPKVLSLTSLLGSPHSVQFLELYGLFFKQEGAECIKASNFCASKPAVCLLFGLQLGACYSVLMSGSLQYKQSGEQF